jgi:hypothetical protein
MNQEEFVLLSLICRYGHRIIFLSTDIEIAERLVSRGWLTRMPNEGEDTRPHFKATERAKHWWTITNQ